MMKKLTVKEMTESEQRDVKTWLDKARIRTGRPLTNSEQHTIKNEAIEKIMQARKKIATASHAEKNPKKTVPDSTTFDWLTSISTRPPR